MKKYTLSFADAMAHKPEHPERTARRNQRGSLDFDITFQVWPSREAMLTTIRLQNRREPSQTDWKACNA